MKPHVLAGSVLLCALAACGLEGMFTNVPHRHYDRPASKLRGAVTWPGANPDQLAIENAAGAIDPDSAKPFDKTVSGGSFQIQLPSARYSFLRVRGSAGNMQLRTLVPFIGEESAADGVDLDPRNMTETLIVEAWLSAQRPASNLGLLTPAAYVGDGLTSGTRTLIRAAFDADPATTIAAQQQTKTLLHMVERLVAAAQVNVSVSSPAFFLEPVYDASFAVASSAVDADQLNRNPVDYDGDGTAERTSAKFDAQLGAVARLYQPAGCPDPAHIRLVFSVDFNAGALNGNCGTVNRFLWAKDAPGKKMFFVGWVHRDSAYQDSAVNALLGASVPNQIPMYDDGTNGDEDAGDGIWTVSFDVPYVGTANPLRIGYKYTWGTRGAPWTGSEEWPGNSRILEVWDVNGDNFVHRRDVFGDEATNKDQMNLNSRGPGSIGWSTSILGAAAGCVDPAGRPIPESHEMPATLHAACTCGSWLTPTKMGSIRIACTQ
jgi:hypothetical protein